MPRIVKLSVRDDDGEELNCFKHDLGYTEDEDDEHSK